MKPRKRARKLNIGPGPNFDLPGWGTLDFYNQDADFHADLRESPRLPFHAHQLKTVFCSHVIEHLEDQAVQSLFKEVHRTLQYGGVARFSCPDAERAIAQYRAGRCDPDAEVISRAARKAPSHLRLLNVLASFKAPDYLGQTNTRHGYTGGPIASEEEVRRRVDESSLEELGKWAVSLIPENATYRAHINAHWGEKLVAMLHEAGFSEAYVSRFRRSKQKELRGEAFDNRPGISLFVEARAGGPRKYWAVRAAGWRRNLKKWLRGRF